ncbi:hypothetical protein [Alkalihalobacterium sp. APHAB7]|uniref:hypothetical protein n=1 Tax=Alkalihalobacterium sp. APHAB7 TaxID=3402081 RepID=UPI003AADBD92
MLTTSNLEFIKTSRDICIELIKKYAIQYKGKEHYDLLGASCIMSATNTVDTLINSSNYLNGKFLMPDEIHLDRLVEWFIKNKDLCDPVILKLYFASYIKKKINYIYRSINRNELSTSNTIMGNEESQREFKKQINRRKKIGVKVIRQDK